MDLAYAFFADAADPASDGRFHVLGGGTTGVMIPDLPASLATLCVVMGLRGNPEECKAMHEVRIQARNPDGSSLVGSHTRIGPLPPHPVGGRDSLFCLITKFPFLTFSQYGTHIFTFGVDGKELGMLAFHVDRQPAQ
jgi:hypothetical protein